MNNASQYICYFDTRLGIILNILGNIQILRNFLRGGGEVSKVITTDYERGCHEIITLNCDISN